MTGSELRAARRRQPSVVTESNRSPSYWLATLPPLPSFPMLETDLTCDVLVVGAGFAGLAASYYAKQLEPEANIVLIESHTVGSGASSRNSGGIANRFRGHDVSPESMRGYELIRQFCMRHDLDVDLESDVPTITLHRHWREPGFPELSGSTLRRAVGSPFYQAATTRTTNWYHPGKMITGLVNVVSASGVQIYEHTSAIQVQPGQPASVVTPGGVIQTGKVILATNGYTPTLGIARQRMFAMHQRVMVTRPLTNAEWERSGLEGWPFRLESGGYYTHTVRSTPDRRFFYRHVLGHRLHEEGHWNVGERERRIGHEEMLRRYPWLEGVPIEYEWHGLTARTRDWWPISGEVAPNVYAALAYNGSGAMATHYFGMLAAHQALGHCHPDLDLLSPPTRHPWIPGGLTRHLAFQGWIEWLRFREDKLGK